MGLVKGFFLVLNTTFNNISVISWRSVLLVEETGVLGENHRPAASNKLYHCRLLSNSPSIVVVSQPYSPRFLCRPTALYIFLLEATALAKTYIMPSDGRGIHASSKNIYNAVGRQRNLGLTAVQLN